MDGSRPANAVLRRLVRAWVGALVGPPVLSFFALSLCAGAVSAGCVSAPRMCVSEPDCGSHASCVAGRCLRRGSVAAVTTAKRWLFAPVDVGVVARGGGAWAQTASQVPHATPVTATLGQGDGATALFRFAIALPPDVTVIEAYVLLREDADVDADPMPLAFHAARITSPWRGDAVTWAAPPRIVEVGAPVTSVVPWPGRAIRIDVRDIVSRWRRRPEEDFGIAVLSERTSATGIAVAMGPMPPGGARSPAPSASVASVASVAPVEGPVLELYVK